MFTIIAYAAGSKLTMAVDLIYSGTPYNAYFFG